MRDGPQVAAIHLGRRLLDGSSSQPGPLRAKHPYPSCDGRAAPIRPCSGWGLPCGCCCQPPGALLPHPFTLACAPFRVAIGGLLSVALSLAPRAGHRRALPATLVSWSPDFPRARKHAAASGPLTGRPIGASAENSKTSFLCGRIAEAENRFPLFSAMLTASAPDRGRAAAATGSPPPRHRGRR